MSVLSPNDNVATIAEIRALFREEITPKLDAFQQTMDSILRRLDGVEIKVAGVEHKVTEVEVSVANAHAWLDEFSNIEIAAIKQQIQDSTRGIILDQLEQQVHRRKWGLNIQGLPGRAGENEIDTRMAVVDWAQRALGVTYPMPTPNSIAACHLLHPRQNANIIVIFTDLTERNA